MGHVGTYERNFRAQTVFMSSWMRFCASFGCFSGALIFGGGRKGSHISHMAHAFKLSYLLK